MLKRLFLIRHAHAVSVESGMKDIERPLSGNGLRDATHIGLYLNDRSIVPDAILSSPAIRTKETVESITNQIHFSDDSVEFIDDLYEPSIRVMARVIGEIKENVNDVLLVSHNPAITYLSEYLTGEPIGNMAPASMVEIEFDGISWSEITQGSGIFKGHIHANEI